jgi:hypothetical protein
MKKAYHVVLLVLAALLIAVSAAAARPSSYRAHLTGAEEVPSVETDAVGQAIIQLNSDGTALSYRLIVANITDVVAAHVHCAPAGVNGPVGVTLFSGSPAGPVNGILAQGTIAAPDADNACGWADLAAVIAAIESGDAYVNVHTVAVGSGEMRGQIK